MGRLLLLLVVAAWIGLAQTPVPVTFAWDLDPSHDQVTAWELETDGAIQSCEFPEVTVTDRRCTAPVIPGEHTFRLRAAWSEPAPWSDPLVETIPSPGQSPGPFVVTFHVETEPVVVTEVSVLPSGIGVDTGWLSSTSSANLWEDVDDVVPDDAVTYLYATASVAQLFTFAPIDVPFTSVGSVSVQWRGRRTEAGPVAVVPTIRTGTTTRSGTPILMTTAWADYSYTWTVNPATGLPWEVDEVEGTDATIAHRLVEFGFTSSVGTGREVQITRVALVIVP